MMKKAQGLLTALFAATVIMSSAQAGTSACDNQKLIVTNTTGETLYLIDQEILGNAMLDNISTASPIPPYTETSVEISSDIGTRGNARAIMHFSANPDDKIDNFNIEFNFNSGWTNYFTCKVTKEVNSNNQFFVTSHKMLDGLQVIIYPKS